MSAEVCAFVAGCPNPLGYCFIGLAFEQIVNGYQLFVAFAVLAVVSQLVIVDLHIEKALDQNFNARKIRILLLYDLPDQISQRGLNRLDIELKVAL